MSYGKIVKIILIYLLSFWEEALYTACFISNRILHKNQNKIPFELWKNRKPKF